MVIQEQINNDFKEAFKAKEQIRLGVLKMLRSEISNTEISKRGKGETSSLTDDDIMTLIIREVKKRKDAEALYTKGGRNDLVENEKMEREILEKYLPAQMSEEEIKSLVAQTILSVGASGIKDLGRVMSELSPKVKGRGDGALISKIVRESLV